MEICPDVQAAPVVLAELEGDAVPAFSWDPPVATSAQWDEVANLLAAAECPAILLGVGVSRACAAANLDRLRSFGVPLLTTWNAMDRLGHYEPLYFGRPDTWGQRRTYIVMQSTVLLLAVGARLSLQQTAFNWQQFTPVGHVVQVEIDQAELDKGHPSSMSQSGPTRTASSMATSNCHTVTSPSGSTSAAWCA